MVTIGGVTCIRTTNFFFHQQPKNISPRVSENYYFDVY